MLINYFNVFIAFIRRNGLEPKWNLREANWHEIRKKERININRIIWILNENQKV